MKPSLSRFSIATLCALAACAPDTNVSGPARHLPNPPAMVAAPQEVAPKGLIPANATPVKVALLLPLSGDSVAVGNAMLDAATMAVSDSYLTMPSDRIRAQIVLLPKDTGNTPADSVQGMKQAIDQGASFVIGPLFSQSVTAIAPMAHDRHLTMLTFSNNKAVAGNGVYLFGFMPEQQVIRMAEYAYLHNYQRVAALVPNDAYGEKVKTTLMEAYTQKGGTVAPTELYAPSPSNIDAAVARLVAAYNNTTEERRFQAIFIADGGAQMKNIIDALKKNRVDLKKIKLLGTGMWDDPEIAKIPEMNGAWFPSSPPGPYQTFEKRFISTYGYKPVRLASLAYDAVVFAAQLATPSANGAGITDSAMTNPDGFNSPANGLFRLRSDGTSQRRLDVMEVTPAGVKVIDVAPMAFENPSPAPAAPPSAPSAPAAP